MTKLLRVAGLPSKPIAVGDYCFVGTGCVLLHAGNPAWHVKQIDESAAYFHRQRGYVD